MENHLKRIEEKLDMIISHFGIDGKSRRMGDLEHVIKVDLAAWKQKRAAKSQQKGGDKNGDIR